MDPQNDIRQRIQVSANPTAASNLLLRRLPTKTANSPETDGLDCLIAAVRRLYSLVPTAFVHADAEENPLLKYAWQTMEANTGDHAAAKTEILRKLNTDKTSFMALCKSKVMNRTLWSMPEFALFGLGFHKAAGSNTWDRIHWEPEHMARKSLVILNEAYEGGANLQEAVNGLFGERTNRNGDVTDISWALPVFVRVHYKSNKPRDSQGPRLSIQDLRSFGLSRDDEKHRYVLVAVVRESPGRAGNGPSNRVRFYSDCGANLILPHHDVSSEAASSSWLMRQQDVYRDCTWSLGKARPCEYMLFFARVDTASIDPNFPEVETLEEVVGLYNTKRKAHDELKALG